MTSRSMTQLFAQVLAGETDKRLSASLGRQPTAATPAEARQTSNNHPANKINIRVLLLKKCLKNVKLFGLFLRETHSSQETYELKNASISNGNDESGCQVI